MVLADVSFGDFIWSLIIIFFMIMYFMIMFHVIVDVFRRDASGANKALWLLFILIVPVFALLVYVISNGHGMEERRMRDVQAQQAQAATYIRDVAGSGGAASEIAKGKELLDSGAITQAEFDKLKASALGS
jgi:ABC-type multidrug transport system fused ATPase/permease subunit